MSTKSNTRLSEQLPYQRYDGTNTGDYYLWFAMITMVIIATSLVSCIFDRMVAIIYPLPAHITITLAVIMTSLEVFVGIIIALCVLVAFRPAPHTNESIRTWRRADGFFRAFVVIASSIVLGCWYLVLGSLYMAIYNIFSAVLVFWLSLDILAETTRRGISDVAWRLFLA